MLLKPRKFFSLLAFIVIVGMMVLSYSVYAATTSTVSTSAATSSANVLVGGLIFEKDLIELLCLDSQWQVGEFLAGVGAYSDFVASSSKEFPDLQAKLADLAAYQKTGQEKISAACSAVSYSQAKAAFNDLNNFEKAILIVLREIDSTITKTFQDKIDSLNSKISNSQKKQVGAVVAQLKASKQGELEGFAKQLSKAAQDSLAVELSKTQFPTPSEAAGYTKRVTDNRQADIKKQLAALASQAQSLLRQEAQIKTLQALGGDSAALSLVVKDVQKNRDTIIALQQTRAGQLDKIKTQALQKRKDLAALILNAQLDNGASRLREKELSNESLSSSLFLNTQQAVDHLASIRQKFLQKAQAALDSGDEKALASAISEAGASYRVLQLELPDVLLRKDNQQEFCSSTPVFKSQMQPQIDRLFLILQKAAKPFSGKAQRCQKKPEGADCAVFNKAFGELSGIQQTAQRINDVFANAAVYCQGAANGAVSVGGGVSLAGLKAFSLQLKQQLIDWQANWPQYKSSF